jgi:parallel beta-helix repeat protein
MKLGKVISVVFIAIAFVGGLYLGQKGDDNIVISSSNEQVSYTGGYDKSADADSKVSGSAATSEAKAGQVLVVKPGESIQDAVRKAQPGDTIQVMPGLYHETVYIDKDDIRLIGVIKNGERATLDGQGKLNDAILYSGNNFVVENFKIVKYKGNGIMGQAGNNFEIRNNEIIDTGVYGIFPQLGKNGIVEHNVVSVIADAAIYIGMSDNIHVAHNEVFDSVAGIEIENSRHCIVESNYVHDNSGGLLAFITPGLPIKTTYDAVFRNNFVINNNTANFATPGSTVSGVPAGTGLLIMAADEVVVEGNIFSGNKTAAIIITDHANAPNTSIDPEADPNSDKVMILDNVMLNNGYDTIPDVKALMLTELKTGNIDIVRIGVSNDSCINNRHRYRYVGIDDFVECKFTNTDNIDTYLLDEPVPPRDINGADRGKIAYLGVCTGCHAYTDRLIGPPIKEIKAIYAGNPEGLAAYIAAPFKKRIELPEMPPQDYLDEETRLAVAKYMLSRNK